MFLFACGNACDHFLIFTLHVFACELNSRRPFKLMMTPVCPRLLNLIIDFVLLRF